jgi:hypothetical protein
MYRHIFKFLHILFAGVKPGIHGRLRSGSGIFGKCVVRENVVRDVVGICGHVVDHTAGHNIAQPPCSRPEFRCSTSTRTANRGVPNSKLEAPTSYSSESADRPSVKLAKPPYFGKFAIVPNNREDSVSLFVAGPALIPFSPGKLRACTDDVLSCRRSLLQSVYVPLQHKHVSH